MKGKRRKKWELIPDPPLFLSRGLNMENLIYFCALAPLLREGLGQRVIGIWEGKLGFEWVIGFGQIWV
ncbi:hypothetical protein A4A49_24163 [Nicotiana attenuata]|uniref:Uncharacterized protein n=1 Tax=Nicotiana attenuata TaxID=49451 RepID=A0A314L3D7_NICAT|nr:hypothetical protein A4A49_24163 [Nicotiana attenuata]